RLDAVRLRERGPDGVEDPRVRSGVRAPRAADDGLVDDGHRRVVPRQAAVDQRALARSCDSGDRHEHAERHVDRDVLQVVQTGISDWDRALRRAWRRLQVERGVEVAPRRCPDATRPSTGPSYTIVPPCGPAPGPM